ncbi:MAG: hypothetical protein U0X20_29895 [Caldilineaceae bacterium]
MPQSLRLEKLPLIKRRRVGQGKAVQKVTSIERYGLLQLLRAQGRVGGARIQMLLKLDHIQLEARVQANLLAFRVEPAAAKRQIEFR